MFHTLIPLTNETDSISRAVITGVARDLVRNLDLPNKFGLILPGMVDNEEIVTDPLPDSKPIQIPSSNLMLTAEEVFAEQAYGTMELRSGEHRPIFYDPSVGYTVEPQYNMMQTTLTMSFRFKSRTEANNLLSNLRIRAEKHLKGFFHKCWYRYLLPDFFFLLTHDIYSKREAQAGYGVNFNEYFNVCSSDELEVVTTQNGQYIEIAKKELQSRINGLFEFDVVPDNAEYETTESNFLLNISYKFTYHKASHLLFKYPLLVHNLPINSKYYDAEEMYDINMRLQAPMKTVFDVEYISPEQTIAYQQGVPSPLFHPYTIKQEPMGSMGLVNVLVVVDPDNPRYVLDLLDIKEYTFAEKTREYLQVNRDKITKQFQSPFFLCLYEDDKILSVDRLIVDEELKVYTTFDMNLRRTYLLYLCVIHQPYLLGLKTQEDMRKDPEFFIHYLEGIYPELIPVVELTSPRRVKKKTDNEPVEHIEEIVQEVKPSVFNQIKSNIQNRSKPLGPDTPPWHARVGVYIVEATRQVGG